MPLSRKEKIGLGLGFLGAAAGIVYVILHLPKFQQLDYVGDDSPSHILRLSFTPKVVYIWQKADQIAQRTEWFTDDKLEWAINPADDDVVDNKLHPLFLPDGFDVGAATLQTSYGSASNTAGFNYRLIAYA